jgi:dTDP-4-dehydrorhamnose reductase
MRILITGLNGIIGWNIFTKASELFPGTLGTYREAHPRLEGLNVSRLEVDIPEALETLLGDFQPEILIHSWAMCDLDICEQFPAMAEKINIEGTRNLLAAVSRLQSLKRFVYISTDHVFDGETGNYSEEDVPRPKHVYGRTKFAAEELVRASGLPWQILRPGLVIGDSLQGRKGPRDFLLTRIRAGKPTHYFTDEWRTPIPAPEMAARMMALACSEESGIFHVAGTEVLSRYDLAQRIARENGHTTEHVFPRLRKEDLWAAIRPKNLSLRSLRV